MPDSDNPPSVPNPVLDGYVTAVQRERDVGLREDEAYIRQQIDNIAGTLNDMRERMDMLSNTINSNHHELATLNHTILCLLRQAMALIREGNHQGLGKFSTPSICHSLSGAK